jgi:hypothetical protein
VLGGLRRSGQPRPGRLENRDRDLLGQAVAFPGEPHHDGELPVRNLDGQRLVALARIPLRLQAVDPEHLAAGTRIEIETGAPLDLDVVGGLREPVVAAECPVAVYVLPSTVYSQPHRFTGRDALTREPIARSSAAASVAHLSRDAVCTLLRGPFVAAPGPTGSADAPSRCAGGWRRSASRSRCATSPGRRCGGG